MLLNSLHDLKPARDQAVIINVGTRWVTTLALLSALRHAEMPVLVIDCEYGDGSFEHFRALMERHEFDLLSAPLRRHGRALDWLFRNIPSGNVLLIDSDIEILDPSCIRLARDLIDGTPDGEEVFGAGFVHGPTWLHDAPGVGYYQERMWIPLTLLRVAAVREALERGLTFDERVIPNDFGPLRPLSVLMEKLRRRYGFLRDLKLGWLAPLRRGFYGQKPAYVHCDTGADVFQYLKYDRGMRFAGLPAELHRRYVTHFHGITRRTLNPGDLNALQNGGFAQVAARLEAGYGVEVTLP